jgi:uncharacterized membrane protein YbhN (UPF0104 family)
MTRATDGPLGSTPSRPSAIETQGDGAPEATAAAGRPIRWRSLASWAFGLVALAALIVVVLHLGDLQDFLDLARKAEPQWLIVALAAQALTYVCAAGVWHRVLAHAYAPRFLVALLPLGIAKVFTDQALPTGGLSGTLLVFRGLLRRRVRPDVAAAALLVGMVSYYGAYLTAVLAAFAVLATEGNATPAVTYAVGAFTLVALAIPAAVVAVLRLGRRAPAGRVRRFLGGSEIAVIVTNARSDLLKRPMLLAETFGLQIAIFLLDSATLWAVFRALGQSPQFTILFVSFVMGSAAATLGPVPLGLGTFEGACTAMLHLQGVPIAPALAATLLLRGFTFWLPMLPGLVLARREIRGTGLSLS